MVGFRAKGRTFGGQKSHTKLLLDTAIEQTLTYYTIQHLLVEIAPILNLATSILLPKSTRCLDFLCLLGTERPLLISKLEVILDVNLKLGR